MKTKEEIVANWLPRYTGMELNQFGEYIILCNFTHYVELFSEWHGVPIIGRERSMMCATHEHISIINFGMGSPNAGTIVD
ncbi:MAG: AMP nucleosidase, partial [Saprospiraceae bacterium]|nr:AMP nucleosidase [Saprospiraceae bacterium]